MMNKIKVNKILTAALAGDVHAQYAVANKYWEGIGVVQNRRTNHHR